MVNIHDIDTTRFSPFFKKAENEFLRFNSLFRNGRIVLIRNVEIVKTRESERIIKSRYVMGTEESNLLIFDKSFIKQFRNLDRIVKFTNSIIFCSFIVLEN